MKKFSWLIVPLLILFLSMPVFANTVCNSELLTVGASTAVSFTAASIVDASKGTGRAQVAYCTVYTGPIMFTIDGTTPSTTTTGHYVAANQPFVITGYEYIAAAKTLSTSGTVYIYCTYSFDKE